VVSSFPQSSSAVEQAGRPCGLFWELALAMTIYM
jgi:hypothetical protein